MYYALLCTIHIELFAHLFDVDMTTLLADWVSWYVVFL